MKDKEIERLIKLEEKRQRGAINLIASENYVSKDVLRALGSVFTNKYAEGYPGKRYYGGNEIVDKVENLAKERALKLFKLPNKKWVVNVQPYSGSPANLAVYLALVPLGAKIVGMSLSTGGHLTHGHKVSTTGKLWNWIHFGVSKKTELLDYDEIRKIARREKPKMIVAGFTAYSRVIDFKKLRKICDEIKAILMIDMSHFAGLVAGGAYPPPFPCADIVTTTTHKTLRGPRAAMIFLRKEFSEAVNKSVFPGLQGGPHINQIAAVAVCLKEAMSPNFKKHARQVVKNARVLARELQKRGWRIISGGTDSHLFLVDTWGRGLSGKTAQELLEAEKIIVNKNTIPYDTRSPFDPSGIRIGTAAVTTSGMKEKDIIKIAIKIDKILKKHANH
ncbi:serine hydroxymethyltransferase [Candidatus Giovannonibacteria bacterium RIFCSPLOWO2_12_FULL_44_25]|uniref:Serine hydroxymethyltransferase n=2 Tax=Candidatus Giovannoniibacteriota TaxID=1752738 RepID=A0A1F5W740_9BACT|nr:MAG: serine hydroxymethyltransferase [Candidatus Giovannonibacteria bacterium GWA2_45_15]OGF60207.1 MAG: serine hydroxymethyltransferase [Candidatus Giovannonibacteria bacterium RIFCSPHIGHO2_01_FULL_44_100]OGF71423.1 MAG: serine hydroxymethyltransferase [Candidatus Giovannonibacteria bacterium RIFCSPHIGHO2_02_FULL_45_40]OGF83651.1 MAG: serine hydroxymethyltransferase [Candidatus Giovannonibacteria bacterium RIFCSPHIGHO2_12_FULL_45_19]OGF86712.1 MAG: serine hydroxymethyltransferase [Candidatu